MGQEFQIEKKVISSNHLGDSYEYALKFKDAREGYCQVNVEKVWQYSFTEAQMKRFSALGIKPNDLCICLDDFHPHGKGLDPGKCDFMRKGVGAKVIEMIIDSLKEHKAKFIYCVASTPSMISFVKKQNWIPCNRGKTVWYKIFENG